MGKPHSKDYCLNSEQRKLVLSKIKDDNEDLVIRGLLFTGLRVSCFIHMRKSWITFRDGIKTKGVIQVPRSQACYCPDCIRKGGEWRVKTKSAVRVIPILDESHPILYKFFSEFNAIGELIPNRKEAFKIVRAVGKRAGIKLFPHALRSTFASILAEKGFTGMDIQQILGWANIKTAEEYVKQSPDVIIKKFEDRW